LGGIADSGLVDKAPPPPGVSFVLARPDVEIAPLRVAPPLSIDFRAVDFVAAAESEWALKRFSLGDRSDSRVQEELQRALRSNDFSGELDQLRNNLVEELKLDKSVTISVAGMTLGMSLIYVLWLIRGGVLMGSYLSALPAWRVLDPLPVLSRVDEETEEDDEALDAVTDQGSDPLRGFG